MEESRQNYPDDEIELIDILKVIWKWKWLIIGGTLACALAAGVISHRLPKIYRVDMIIRPGVAQIQDNGNYLYLDNEENIKAIIEAGTFDHIIMEEWNGKAGNPDRKLEKLDFDIQLTNKTNTIKVSYNTPFPDQGEFILGRLHHHLINYYAPIVERFRKKYELDIYEEQAAIAKLDTQVVRLQNSIKAAQSDLETEISTLRNDIQKLEAGKKSQDSLIENESRRVEEIEQELERVAKNTDVLIKQRNGYMEQVKSNDNALSSIIYSNTIQQNISYLDALKSRKTEALNRISESTAAVSGYELDIEKARTRIEDIKQQKLFEIEEIRARIEDLQSDRAYKNQKIEDLNFKKENIGNVQQLERPIRSPGPVSPRILMNIALASIAAFFMMLFASFMAEYISQASRADKGVDEVQDKNNGYQQIKDKIPSRLKRQA